MAQHQDTIFDDSDNQPAEHGTVAVALEGTQVRHGKKWRIDKGVVRSVDCDEEFLTGHRDALS